MPVKDGKIFCSNEGNPDESIWTCRLSGKTDLLFNDAVKSEEKHRKDLMVNIFLDITYKIFMLK